MKVRRTGAKRGCSPTFYIQADTDGEKEAVRQGLLEDVAPWPRKYVLAWGFGSKAAAEAAMEGMEEQVAAAVAQVEGDGCGTASHG